MQIIEYKLQQHLSKFENICDEITKKNEEIALGFLSVMAKEIIEAYPQIEFVGFIGDGDSNIKLLLFKTQTASFVDYMNNEDELDAFEELECYIDDEYVDYFIPREVGSQLAIMFNDITLPASMLSYDSWLVFNKNGFVIKYHDE